jgi:hypothetical protein
MKMLLLEIACAVAALYSGGMWLYLARHSLKRGADVEVQTFHLGLCLILALGFLGLMVK